MLYKIGDKVKIKTWERLKRECEPSKFSSTGTILTSSLGAIFTIVMEHGINEKASDRILTINHIRKNGYYNMKEVIGWYWSDYMIEELVIEHYTIFDHIGNRFELMDFE